MDEIGGEERDKGEKQTLNKTLKIKEKKKEEKKNGIKKYNK